jgi:biopolymer transport protein ExbD
MAFSFNGGGSGMGSLGRGRFRGGSAMADINIVPLVDVVLVLLIIFMLTAHVMEFGLEVNVPQVRQVKDSAQELPVVNITKNGLLYLNENPVNINDLVPAFRQRFGQDNAIYVRADKDTIWDVIAQVISQLSEGGVKDIRMVTQPQDEAERASRR